MAQNHLHTLLLLALLLLVSCENEVTYPEQDISYSDKSELYGIWKWRDIGISLYSKPVPYSYVLNDSASYYLSQTVFNGYSEGYIFIGKIQWELSATNSIAMSPAWHYLQAPY